MDTQVIFQRLDSIHRDSHIAALATIDAAGFPRMRWMTPCFLPGNKEFVYAVTSPDFTKVLHLAENAEVEWMFQPRTLTEVITVRGEMRIIDNPSLKAEVIASIGGRLGVFWRLNEDESKLLVLETRIMELRYFKPMTGEKAELKL